MEDPAEYTVDDIDKMTDTLEGEWTVDHSPLFDGATVIICMPVLYHVEPESFESIVIAMSRFNRKKVRFMAQEKTCVWESRNRLVWRFLKTDAEWMLFIDADMGVPCGDADYFNNRFKVNLPTHIAGVNAISKFLGHSRDKLIVGASYPDRQFGTQYQNSRGCGSHAEIGFNDRYRQGYYNGVGEVLWTATGAMRIHRSVFDILRKNADKFQEIVPLKPDGIWGFFNPRRVGMGEDVSFCARARLCGIKTWLDYDLRFSHKGTKHHV